MRKYILLTATFFISIFSTFAQDFEKASDYIEFIKQNHKGIYQDVVVYVRNLERGETVKSVDVLRKAIVKKLESTIVKVNGMPKYKGDNSLQDSLVSYSRRTHVLFTRDYVRIQKSQDSIGKSYEATRRAVTAKSNALNSLIEDEKKFFEAIKSFSSKYAVPVPPKYNMEYEKLTTISEVSQHHTILLLMYAKCKTEEAYLAKSIDTKQKAGIEQHSAALSKFVTEGYRTLDTLKPFNGDRTLIEANRSLLNFYQHECEFKVPALLSFLSRGGEDHSKSKVDAGNNVNVNPHVNVEDHDGVSTYANNKADLDTERTQVLENWKKASQTFLKKQLQD